jgi:cytochrome c oxidase assembly factor CtaG
MKILRTLRIAGWMLMLPLPALAHEGGEHVAPGNLWSAWSFEPWVIAGIVLTSTLYIMGLRRMRSTVPRWQIGSFVAGIAALVLTLLSPIHRLGAELFSAHMTQHELLMLIAAPLLVLGRPGTPMLWALPFAVRVRLAHMLNGPLFAPPWQAISSPFAAWLIHGVSLWVWHVPVFYQATLNSELVHAAQHATFLATALLFWWALIHGRGGRMSYGIGVAYVFTTAVHTSVLGALLTCSTKIWYPIYEGRTAPWGLTPLQDQQLGGLIMWVPAGLVYIAIGLWLFAKWLEESERRLAYSQSTDLLRPETHTLPHALSAPHNRHSSAADGVHHA